MESASKGGTPDAQKPGVSAARGRPGGDQEAGGEIARVTEIAAAVPGLALDGRGGGGASCDGGGEGIACIEGAARAKREGEASPKKQEDRESGRCRGGGGGVVARPVDTLNNAVDGERGGDALEIGIDRMEDHHPRDRGVVCQEHGVNGLVGADGAIGDYAVEDARPPAAWTSSKRPRKDDAIAAEAV